MVRSGARISILICCTSPGLSAAILSGLNSTVHLSFGFLVIKERFRIGAVPAFPTRKSIGLLVPAVNDVLSVPLADPILRSWVPFVVTLKFVLASYAPARARTFTGYSLASAVEGESISTLSVSVAFSLS